MSQPPSGLVTFLLTDMVHYSGSMERFPAEMRQAIARHNALIVDCIRRHEGHVHREHGEGDSIFAAFQRADQALAAAVEAQIALIEEPWPLSLPVRVRLALNTGEVELTDEDYFSPVPNRCSRLRDICHGRQILLTRATFEQVRDQLPRDVTLLSLGTHRLRDLTEPEEVFQVCHPRLPRDFPPLPSVDSQPNNLPSQASSFVGRKTEMNDLWRAIDRGQPRILSLVGEGGCGKTRLALQLAAELMPRTPDGTWFVDLSSLVDPVELPRSVAAVLGVREQPGIPLQQAITTAIGRQAHLIVLDNCERLVDAAVQFVAAAVSACPNLRILVTSREALRCRGEMVYPLPPLGLPTPGQRLLAEDVNHHDATHLFAERALFSAPTLTVGDEDAALIAEICHRLDGNALAIELAAAQVQSHTLADIAAELFELLDQGPRDAPERHRSVDAVTRWTYEDLPAPHQQLFCRLSVFAGGWTEDAARYIGSGGDIALGDVGPLQRALVDKSLVHRRVLPDGSERYDMHSLVRYFGRRQLARSADASHFAECHAGYFMAIAERAEPELQGPGQREWLLRLDREADNIRAALRCMREHRLAESGLRTAGSLWRYWYARGLLGEGRDQLERALALRDASVSAAKTAPALNGAGALAFAMGDVAAAEGYFRAMLATYEALGDPPGMARALNNLGMVAFHRGDYAEARVHFGRCLELSQGIGNSTYTATATQNLVLIEHALGHCREARALGERSLDLARAASDDWAVAFALCELGSIVQDLGEYDTAVGLYDESLSLGERLGYRSLMAWALATRASARRETGALEAAEAELRQALAIAREIGEQRCEAVCIETLAALRLDRGELTAAEEQLGESLALREELGDRRGRCHPLLGLARLDLMRGQAAAAEPRCREVLRIQQTIQDYLNATRSLETLAASWYRGGDRAKGLDLLARVAEIRRHRGTPRPPSEQAFLHAMVGSLPGPGASPGPAPGVAASAVLQALIAEVVGDLGDAPAPL